MSDSEMDVELNEELPAFDGMDVPGNDANGVAPSDMRCPKCNEAFDGLSRAPSTCVNGVQCMKCNDGTEVKDVFMTPRDILSPEPPQDKGGNGESGDSRNKEQASRTALIAEPSLEAASSSEAEVKVKCINGATVTAKVNPNSTKVLDLKKTVHQQTGISSERQHLLFKGKNLIDAKTLKESKVTHGATLQMGNKCYGG
ncbi:viral Ubiquitin [Frankliniella fusca]|uniref:Viral Ubiquitin n=1 Tax=Frankliniella fusca TaxID=407009 RepID=A0AAE1LH19_9NEOP|nr:viral Ubiquitin [Frankliniella fusca]